MRIMLTLIDREEISRGLAEDLLFAEIALRIGRDPSVVSRDVARHGGRSGYRAVVAEQTACAARERPKPAWVSSAPSRNTPPPPTTRTTRPNRGTGATRASSRPLDAGARPAPPAPARRSRPRQACRRSRRRSPRSEPAARRWRCCRSRLPAAGDPDGEVTPRLDVPQRPRSPGRPARAAYQPRGGPAVEAG